MTRVTLEAGNPLDVKVAELQDLADEIRAADPSLTVEILDRDVRRGPLAVTFWEVFLIYIPAALSYTPVLEAAVRYLRRRFKKSPDRPKSVTIYSADGTPLKSVVVRAEDSEPEEKPARTLERRAPPDTLNAASTQKRDVPPDA